MEHSTGTIHERLNRHTKAKIIKNNKETLNEKKLLFGEQ